MRMACLAVIGLGLLVSACNSTKSEQTGSIATADLAVGGGRAGGTHGEVARGDGGGADPVATGSIKPTASARSVEVDPGVVSWYAERHARFPDGDVLTYCHAYGCELQTAIPITATDLEQLKAIFANAKTPADERIGIDHAVSWWENRAAPHLGGPPDRRGSEPKDAHVPGQTDCLDEATNSTTILVFLERKGLLQFHHTLRPDSRGGLLYAHATAVFRDTIAGKDWVVDSWMRDSGDPNDVMPLDEWLSKPMG